MLRRNNDVIAKYLPAKYDLVVFCVLTDAQKQLYRQELEGAARSKTVAKADGGGTSTFKTLTALRKLCAHPQLIADDPLHRVALGALGVLPAPSGYGGGGAVKLRPQLSGKMATLLELLLQVKKELSKSVKKRSRVLTTSYSYRLLLLQVKKTTTDRWVLVSNFTQTLDLFGELLEQNNMSFQRLDGSINANKRQVMVDSFNNDPSQYAFLLSSKAGGCGLNLIGANRLVLFDPDWNPANDQQALARVWRSGQKKACYIYRFFGAGTIEEKTYERQLSKEGLAGQVRGGDS